MLSLGFIVVAESLFGFLREELLGEGGLAGTIGTGDDQNLFHVCARANSG
jgi:hypothetical protein